VSRANSTATKRAWLSRFMDFGSGPEPLGGWGGATTRSRLSSMSNFAAMSATFQKWLKSPEINTSEIIDAFSNVGYAFLEVSLGFCIPFPLRSLWLQQLLRLTDAVSAGGMMVDAWLPR